MWNEKDNPSRIERRFEFENYSKTSLFMKDIDNLCKSKNIFPNISFGSQFVGITIFLKKQICQMMRKNSQKKLMIYSQG